MTPKRIQLSRKKGYRKPPDAVTVARPTKWGNPHKVTKHTGERSVWWQVVGTRPDTHYIRFSKEDATACAVTLYAQFETRGLDVTPLSGKDLACWCPLDQPCHADVLLELANQ